MILKYERWMQERKKVLLINFIGQVSVYRNFNEYQMINWEEIRECTPAFWTQKKEKSYSDLIACSEWKNQFDGSVSGMRCHHKEKDGKTHKAFKKLESCGISCWRQQLSRRRLSNLCHALGAPCWPATVEFRRQETAMNAVETS